MKVGERGIEQFLEGTGVEFEQYLPGAGILSLIVNGKQLLIKAELSRRGPRLAISVERR